MSTTRDNVESRSSTSRFVDSVDQMVRLPLEMTGATWDLMMRGMQSVSGGMQNMAGGLQTSTEQRSSRTRGETGRGSNGTSTAGSSWTSEVMGQDDQDLSGDDLKYVIWSIAFTKPGYECVLEPQHEEIVNYSADGASFAALKIAKFLEKARHGRAARPELWGDTYPPAPAKASGRKTEPIAASTASGEVGGGGASSDKGWRIPAEDQKYVTFLYRVEHRLPKQEVEVTRVERVTVERGGTAKL